MTIKNLGKSSTPEGTHLAYDIINEISITRFAPFKERCNFALSDGKDVMRDLKQHDLHSNKNQGIVSKAGLGVQRVDLASRV